MRYCSVIGIAVVFSTLLIAFPACKYGPSSVIGSGIQNQAIVSTFAGTNRGFLNGGREIARFSGPHGLAFDASGSCYVADSGNNCIRKISPDGDVFTFTGGILGKNDGIGTRAQFHSPLDIAFDSKGDLFVADTQNNSIRKITQEGVVSTIAGGIMGYAEGNGTSARFNLPNALAFDKNGNLFVADILNHAIRMIAPTGEVSTFAGGSQGNTTGTGGQAQFNTSGGIAFDDQGNLFVVDTSNCRIMKVTPDRAVTTYAGSTQGFTDGTVQEAKFAFPTDIAFDSTGRMLVADTGNQCIRIIGLDGTVTTIAGGTNGMNDGSGVRGKIDGTGSMAKFDDPINLAFDSTGCLYVSDAENCLVRSIRYILK